MIDIQNIESMCKLNLRQLGGIKRLRITDFLNFNGIGISAGAEIYTIHFRPFTASFMDDGKSSKSGDYHTGTARAYIPRHRFLAEKLVMELADRRCIVYALDYNGTEHILYGAKFQSKYETGSQLADSNGYEWEWSMDYVKKPFLGGKLIVELSGDEGVTAPEDPGGTVIGPGPSPPPSSNECCITIHVTPIAYVPTPTGNIAHRNKMIFSSSDGNKYFIDKNGASMLMGSGTLYESFTGPAPGGVPTTISLANPSKLIVAKNGVIMNYDPSLSQPYSYNIVGGSVIPFLGLEDGDFLQIYQIG